MTTTLASVSSTLYSTSASVLSGVTSKASQVANTYPISLATSALSHLGSTVSHVAMGHINAFKETVVQDLVHPLCSLKSLETPCRSLGLSSFLPVKESPTLMQNFWNALGFGEPEPTLFEKLSLDASQIGNTLLDYVSSRPVQFGAIFSLATLALYSKGANKEGAKASAKMALGLSMAQLALSRYGFLNSLTGFGIGLAFAKGGVTGGVMAIAKLTFMRTLMGTLTAYLGAPIVSALLLGSIFLPMAMRASSNQKGENQQPPTLKLEDLPEPQRNLLERLRLEAKEFEMGTQKAQGA